MIGLVILIAALAFCIWWQQGEIKELRKDVDNIIEWGAE